MRGEKAATTTCAGRRAWLVRVALKVVAERETDGAGDNGERERQLEGEEVADRASEGRAVEVSSLWKWLWEERPAEFGCVAAEGLGRGG